MQGESLTVQIRSPSMSETLTLTTQRDASVHALKQLIHTVHPKKPTTADQRIIFAGKLLNDTDSLSRILEKTDVNAIPTFHLVVKPSLITTSNAGTTATTINNNSTTTSSSSPFMNTRPTVPSPLSNVISAAEATSTPPHSAPQPESATGGAPSQTGFTTFQQAMPGYPSLLPGGYQVIALNGQYYLAPVLVPAFTHQLQQQQQQHLFQQQSFQSQGHVPHPQQPIFPQQQPQQQPQAQAQAQQGMRAPVFVHAQNRVQRATSVWLALKLIFILFILCQDASLERILFFHVLAFIFFLYQTGRLRFVIQRVRPEDLNRLHPQQPQPQPNQPPAVPTPTTNSNNNNNNTNTNNNDNNNNNNNNNPVGAGAAGGASAPSPQPNNEQASAASSSNQQNQRRQQQQPTTLLGTIKRGAYTFVASLWPNYGHDARIAQALDNGQNEAWEGI